MEPTYLGDGVYIQSNPHDPSALILTTANHYTSGRYENPIFIDSVIAEALVKYIEKWKTS